MNRKSSTSRTRRWLPPWQTVVNEEMSTVASFAPSSIAAKGFLPEGIDANRTTFAGMEMSLVGGVGKEGDVMLGEGADNRNRRIGIVADDCWGGSAVREVSLFQEPGQEPATTWVIDRVRQRHAAQRQLTKSCSPDQLGEH